MFSNVGDKRFKWQFNWIQAFLTKSISHSAAAVNNLAAEGSTPVSNSLLWSNMSTFVKALLLDGIHTDTETTCIAVYDNVGKYHPKQRNTQAERAYIAAVVTSVVYFHLLNDGAELTQKSIKHSHLIGNL